MTQQQSRMRLAPVVFPWTLKTRMVCILSGTMRPLGNFALYAHNPSYFGLRLDSIPSPPFSRPTTPHALWYFHPPFHCQCGLRWVAAFSMDVVLEVFDTFLFDRFYAAALPASILVPPRHVVTNTTTTFSSMRELPTAIARTNQLFQLKPSQYAYMSHWGRDNTWRQGISLYLVCWYRRSPQTSSPDFSNPCIVSSAPSSTSSAPPSPTSSSSTMPPSPTRNTSRTKSVKRSSRPSPPSP